MSKKQQQRLPVEAVEIPWRPRAHRSRSGKQAWLARKHGLRLSVRPHYTGLWIAEICELIQHHGDREKVYDFLYSALYRTPRAAKDACRVFVMNGYGLSRILRERRETREAQDYLSEIGAPAWDGEIGKGFLTLGQRITIAIQSVSGRLAVSRQAQRTSDGQRTQETAPCRPCCPFHVPSGVGKAMSSEKAALEPRYVRQSGPMHEWFGLSYSSYLVLHRSMIQEMPTEWQARLRQCLDELDEAFAHIINDEAQFKSCYVVTPREHWYGGKFCRDPMPHYRHSPLRHIADTPAAPLTCPPGRPVDE